VTARELTLVLISGQLLLGVALLTIMPIFMGGEDEFFGI